MSNMELVFEEDMGDVAICDICNRDYTGLPDKGGFIWKHRAVCPACAENVLGYIGNVGRNDEISHTCQEGESFSQMVVRYRGGNNMMRLYVTKGG